MSMTWQSDWICALTSDFAIHCYSIATVFSLGLFRAVLPLSTLTHYPFMWLLECAKTANMLWSLIWCHSTCTLVALGRSLSYMYTQLYPSHSPWHSTHAWCPWTVYSLPPHFFLPLPPPRTYTLHRGVVGSSGTASTSGGSDNLLPLWGQICCTLMAQPDCATDIRITGFINTQVS